MPLQSQYSNAQFLSYEPGERSLYSDLIELEDSGIETRQGQEISLL
jgi:hypothetical protein